MNTNTPALDKFLAKHKPYCWIHLYSGDRHCSCGRDEAIKELQDLKNNNKELSKKVSDSQDEMEEERAW